MLPQDVIRAVEKHKMVIQPCLAGKTWTALVWRNGIRVEARKHTNMTCAVRSLNFKLEGLPPSEPCCGDKDDE